MSSKCIFSQFYNSSRIKFFFQKFKTLLCVSRFFISIQKIHFKFFWLLVFEKYSEVRLNPTTLSYKIPHKQLIQVRTYIGPVDTLIPSSFNQFTYMGGTGPRVSSKIIFRNHVYSCHTIQNIKFGVNRMFHVLKTPVYRFDYYGRYRILWTDEDNFWQCYLELVYKPKY